MRRINDIIFSAVAVIGILSGPSAFAQSAPAPAEPVGVAEAALAPPAEDNGFEDYSVIVDKNIFGYLVTTATPPEPAETEIPAELAPLPIVNGAALESQSSAYVLTGIVEIGDLRKAIIQDTASDTGYYVATGDAVSEYTVKEIEKQAVVLENNGRELRLVLEENKVEPEPAAEPAEEEDTKKMTPDMVPYPQRGRFGNN